MRRKNVNLIIALIVVFIVTIIIGAYFYDESKRYVAKVDGQKITINDYKFFLAEIIGKSEQTANISGQNSRKSFWSRKIGNVKAEDYVKDVALQKALEYKIQLIKAKEEKLKVDEKGKNAVDAYINRIINAYGGKVGAEKIINKYYGFPISSLKKIQMNIELIGKFSSFEMGKIKFTDKDLSDYYAKNKDSNDSITVRQIFFSTKSSYGIVLPSNKKAEIKKNAESVLLRIKAGEDFTVLAKQYSDDTKSRDNGGKTVITNNINTNEYDSWCLNSGRKPGDIGLVETTAGYYIIKFEKRTTFNDVKDKVKSNYLNDMYKSELSNWKKDKKYKLTKNNSVLEAIDVLNL